MSIEVKEIASYSRPYIGSTRYFIAEHTDKKVLFKVGEWASETPRTIEEIKAAYESAEFPSYHGEPDYSYPLAIFSLTIFKMRNEITSNNMSLWEYERISKGNEDVHPALKCAFIQHNDEDNLSVMCESYDDESMTTNANLRVVYEHWHKIKGELMTLLGKRDEYLEVIR